MRVCTPLALVASNRCPSGLTTTPVGYQPTGMYPLTVNPLPFTSMTAIAFKSAMAAYNVFWSGESPTAMGVAPYNPFSALNWNCSVLSTESVLVETTDMESLCAFATYNSDCDWLNSRPVGCAPVGMVISSVGFVGSAVFKT